MARDSTTTSTFSLPSTASALSIVAHYPAVTVAHASSDTTSRSSSLASATATPFQAHESGLSGAGQLGLGIGVSIAGLLVLFGLFVLWRRRRKPSAEHDHGEINGTAEVAGESKNVPQLDESNALLELVNDPRKAELGDNARAELESGWRGWEAPTSEAIHLPHQEASTNNRRH